MNRVNQYPFLSIVARDTQILPYRKELREIAGSVTATIFLGQLIYWVGKIGNDFWKYKSPCKASDYKIGDSWVEELGFTLKELDGAMDKLKERGLLTTSISIDRKMKWKLNLEILEKKLQKLYDDVEFTKMTNCQLLTDKMGFTKMTNCQIVNDKLSDSIYVSETTTENKEKINKKESQSANENSLSLEAKEFHQKALFANQASYPSRENMEQNQDFAMCPSEKPKRVRFTKPTIQQLIEYNAAVDLEVDCEVFYDYYESNGWRVGKSPMKDWKAAMRNWHRKQKSFRGSQNSIDLDEIYEKR